MNKVTCINRCWLGNRNKSYFGKQIIQQSIECDNELVEILTIFRHLERQITGEDHRSPYSLPPDDRALYFYFPVFPSSFYILSSRPFLWHKPKERTKMAPL
ncbi:Uncharacterised protein [Vibrio cholerae]|uniref:Uncharacterized protein n=1 Tax=Vibrio cholerae TaxID=666 RepID=A0A655UMW8_VIBCL|nr:Uncharacterised protein [Vibrio cholerae]CRZ82054.1 Uncharacterised protein [Vibrio cholerae]CSA36215.1 Uncharacterised protein [Vibrio cholerae]CSA80986.1 Uncharacterised protein [Vibrio cholerae]CSB53252.1 Uncharacterised protein [Vibrio cholerae]